MVTPDQHKVFELFIAALRGFVSAQELERVIPKPWPNNIITSRDYDGSGRATAGFATTPSAINSLDTWFMLEKGEEMTYLFRAAVVAFELTYDRAPFVP